MLSFQTLACVSIAPDSAAFIFYQGYDMEDAMIINKSSYERGFAHGSMLKSEFVTLSAKCYFGRDPSLPNLAATLDEDGLPYPG